jgi:hypothetical protein
MKLMVILLECGLPRGVILATMDEAVKEVQRIKAIGVG